MQFLDLGDRILDDSTTLKETFGYISLLHNLHDYMREASYNMSFQLETVF